MEVIKENKENIATCESCHLGIRHVEDYVLLTEYIKGLKRKDSYYHRTCFINKVTRPKEIAELKNIAQGFMMRAESLLKGAGY